MNTMARLVVLMDPEDKRELEERARQGNVSLAEVVRRRLSSEPDPDEAAFFEALSELGQSARQATAAIEADLADARQMRATQADGDEKVRRAVRSGLPADELTALAQWLRPAFEPPTATERA